MKLFILFFVISTAFAIPKRAPQIAEVFPEVEYELSEPSDVQPETYESDLAMRLNSPTFDEIFPGQESIDIPVDELYPVEGGNVDEVYPVDEIPLVVPVVEDSILYKPTNDVYPVEETPEYDMIPEEEVYVVDELIPEESPVDTDTNDDSFIFIRYPQLPSLRHPFLRLGPVFQIENTDANEESFFTRPRSRRPSLFDILFPEMRRGFNPQSPSPFPAEETEHPIGHSHNGFHTVYSNFFNHPRGRMPNYGGIHSLFNNNFPTNPRRPNLPTFIFDQSDHPANYTNSTHNIHEINGTKFAVNETIKKHSGDNFNSFFHVRVIQHLPETPVIEEDADPTRGDTVDNIDAIDTATRGATVDTSDNIDVVNPEDTVNSEVLIPVEENNEVVQLPETYNDADNEVLPNAEVSPAL